MKENGDLRFARNLPVRVLLLVILGAFVLRVPVLLAEQLGDTENLSQVSTTAQESDEAMSTHEEWNGVFKTVHNDIDDEYLAEEALYLSFDASGVVEGGSSAELIDGGNAWSHSGYLAGDTLAMAYKSDGGEQGVGVYILRYQQPSVYLGHWEGKARRNTAVVKCPYVLAKSPVESIRAQWGDFLDTPCHYLSVQTGGMRPVLSNTN
ncbi:MAG: hypothetical protein AAF699_09980 [Pseudomonadota bacterium]